MHRKHNPDVVIRTDASPYGMGGILFYKGNPQKWWASALTPDDLSLFAATIGDPAFQAEWELLAILTSVVAWADCLQSCLVGMIESDIWAALNATMKMASSTPSMNALGAEIGIRMASYLVDGLTPKRVATSKSRPYIRVIWPLEVIWGYKGHLKTTKLYHRTRQKMHR